MVAVEGEAAGRRDVEAGVDVACGVLEGNGDAAEAVDDGLEGAEIDLDEVVDLDAEVVVNRK